MPAELYLTYVGVAENAAKFQHARRDEQNNKLRRSYLKWEIGIRNICMIREKRHTL